MNDAGQIVGKVEDARLVSRATLWTIDATGQVSARSLGTLGALDNLQSEATDINDRGEVVGWSHVPVGEYDVPQHAFLWTAGGGMEDLGTLGGGGYSHAFAINELGHVVGGGQAQVPGLPVGVTRYQAFLWTPEVGMAPLDPPGSLESHGYGVNDRDEVVGSCGLSACLWSPGEDRLELPSGGSPGAQVRAINGDGTMVGDTGAGGVVWRVRPQATEPIAAPGGEAMASCSSGPGGLLALLGLAGLAVRRRR